MNINTAKNIIKGNVGKMLLFRYNGLRNQKEEFYGIITKVFPSIFIIELSDGTVRSFSYGDFIIKNIMIVC